MRFLQPAPNAVRPAKCLAIAGTAAIVYVSLYSQRCRLGAGLVLALVAFILTVVGIASPYSLVTSTVDPRKAELSLMRLCFEPGPGVSRKCEKWSHVSDNHTDVCGQAPTHKKAAGLLVSGVILEAFCVILIAVTVRAPVALCGVSVRFFTFRVPLPLPLRPRRFPVPNQIKFKQHPIAARTAGALSALSAVLLIIGSALLQRSRASNKSCWVDEHWFVVDGLTAAQVHVKPGVTTLVVALSILFDIINAVALFTYSCCCACVRCFHVLTFLACVCVVACRV